MKKNHLLLAVTVLIAAMGCQKNLHDSQFEHDQLNGEAGIKNIVVDCTPTTLSGTISTNTTLLSGKRYILDGIVVVQSATLTIQPGTLIEARTAVTSGLVIDKTAQINAVGTATSPIVFTSDKSPGSRAPGDWLGVYFIGNAQNNQSNALALSIEGTSFTAGGTSGTGSAGSFEHIQIHFAGRPSSTGDELTKGALVLASVGSGMLVRDIQITNSLNDALAVWGGAVGVKEVFAYKAKRWDFAASQGYRGNMQNLFGFKDNVATTVSNSTSMYITNNLRGTDSAPFTYPIISNATLLGGAYCSGSDADYNRAITIGLNGSAQIFNSVIEGFSQYALYLDGESVIAKTKAVTDQLKFSYNSLHDLGTPQYAANFSPKTDWVTADGCRLAPTKLTMQDWIDGSSDPGCTQAFNQFALSATGYYENSLCGDKCTNFPNLFINESTYDLEDPEYSMLSGFFDQPAFRGALQSEANTWLKDTWLDFCMVTRNYCE